MDTTVFIFKGDGDFCFLDPARRQYLRRETIAELTAAIPDLESLTPVYDTIPEQDFIDGEGIKVSKTLISAKEKVGFERHFQT